MRLTPRPVSDIIGGSIGNVRTKFGLPTGEEIPRWLLQEAGAAGNDVPVVRIDRNKISAWCAIAHMKTKPSPVHVSGFPCGWLSLRKSGANRNHHIWNNNGIWWLHATVHLADHTKRRVRVSLSTKSLKEARLRRDFILSGGGEK